ncbi:MAG: CocE/NonD family hydrolase [Candidatus Hodarchaeota archaeon]
MANEFLWDIYTNFTFNLEDLINTNLLYSALARVIFIVFFLCDYLPLQFGKSESESHSVSREIRKKNWKDWIWFAGKETMIILVGMLHLSITILVIGYSFMLAGSHMVASAKRSQYKANLVFAYILGIFIKYVVPILAIIASAYMFIEGTDPNAFDLLFGTTVASLMFSTRTIIGFVLMKKVERRTNIEDAFKTSKKNIAQRTPRVIKVAFLSVVVISPIALYLVIDNTVAIKYWTEMVPSEFDGTLLATDIYRSKSASVPQPVILIRTPYGKGSLGSSLNAFVVNFIKEGYVVVYQDMRGTHASNGDFEGFLYDAYDGNSTVNWIMQQDWCDGNIGSWGGSAFAINEYYYAGETPNGLKYQEMAAGSPELYDHIVFQGGAFRKALYETWLIAMTFSIGKLYDAYHENLNNTFTHPTKDAFWNTTSLSMNNRYANVNVTGLHIGGWFDPFQQGTIDGFNGYNHNGLSFALGHQRMIMGPGGHGIFQYDGIGDLTFPRGTELFGGWSTELKNFALKGINMDWSGPNVAYYLMGEKQNTATGANKWVYTNDWPLNHTDDPWYFHGNGSLLNSTIATQENISYIYDPSNPVPTVGGNNLMEVAALDLSAIRGKIKNYEGIPIYKELWQGIGPKDHTSQEVLENVGENPLLRPDVINFTSAELTQPVNVVGRITARLNVSSNCTDTAFTVKLLDVYPNGRIFNINDGILIMRRRNGLDQDDTMVPSTTYLVDVDLWSTAYQFNTGHRIMVAISSSNYPRFERHPNTFSTLNNNPTNITIANNTLHLGDSCIFLPRLI